MGTLIVVKGDKVEGTDKHNVSGNATNPAPHEKIVFSGVRGAPDEGWMVNWNNR